MSRSKDIGTLAETMVTRWFATHGFPHAKRLVLHGSKDIGDVSLGDGIPVVVEVKGGSAAESASDQQMRLWLRELHTEMNNASESGTGHYGVLVVKRKGFGATKVGGWWALTIQPDLPIVRWRLDEFTERYLTKFIKGES